MITPENRRVANRAFLEALAVLWDTVPDQRFGQLVMNLSRTPGGFADVWEWSLGDFLERIGAYPESMPAPTGTVRHTPFLDKIGVQMKDHVPAHAVNVIDAALAAVSALTDWGEYEGRRRKPCPGQPLLLAGMPLGMYHCEFCGQMELAGLPHSSPSAPVKQDPNYPLSDYEDEYQRPWPAGYEGDPE